MADLNVDVLHALPEAIVVVLGERIAWLNARACELLGANADALIDRRFDEVVVPTDATRLRVARHLRSRNVHVPARQRLRFITAAGAEVAVEVQVGFLPNGAEGSFVVSARGLEEIGRAEQLGTQLARALGETGAFDDLDTVLTRCEPIFACRGLRLAVIERSEGGARLRRVLGGVAGDPLTELAERLMSVTLTPENAAITFAAFETGQTIYFDAPAEQLAQADGVTGKLASAISQLPGEQGSWIPVVVEGRTKYVLLVAGKGLTEHDCAAIECFAHNLAALVRIREIQGEMVARERLAAIGEMSAVLAHEIRNPLTVVLNATRGLRRLIPAHTPDIAELLDVLDEEANRMRALSRDLIALATPHRRASEEILVRDVIAQALRMARADPAGRRAQRIEVDVAPTLPGVRGDPQLLERAVMNLILNAMQHVVPHGRLAITASADRGGVRIGVFNEGPLLSPDIERRAFDPFVSGREGGTGLGLTVVRRVAEDVGGRVTYEKSDEGPRFSIWLPGVDGAGRPLS